jgi:hypothetical protein
LKTLTEHSQCGDLQDGKRIAVAFAPLARDLRDNGAALCRTSEA